MNKVKSVLFMAGVLLALVFTFSCSSGGGDSGGQGGSFNENSQIYYEDGTAYKGSGIIKMSLYDENRNKTLIDAGSVKDGIVKLELPQTIPDEYLHNFSGFNILMENGIIEQGAQGSCTDYLDEDVKEFTSVFSLTNSDGSYMGGVVSKICG